MLFRSGEARALYTRFLRLPSPRNPRLEAIVRVNQLEASIRELVEPRAKLPVDIDDPRGKAQLHPELVSLIAAARAAAGSDDAVLGSIDILEAQSWQAAGQWNRYKNAYSEALEAAERARKHFETIGDARRTAIVFATEAEIYLERADERALDDALFAARQAADTLERAQRDPLPVVDAIRARIAFMRRDLTEAHRRSHETGATILNREIPSVHGRIDGMPGDRPVTVTAWTGALAGDRGRVVTSIGSLDGEMATPQPDGSFSIKAIKGWLVIAEAKGLRSKPQKIDKEPITLKLEPTTTLSGTVTGLNLMDVKTFARFDLAGHDGLTIYAPVDRDATFDLAGLPAGMTPVLGTEGPAGDGTRTLIVGDIKNMTWPAGQAVDVIARGKLENDAQVYVIRGHLPSGPISASEFRGLLPATIEVATCTPQPIGANNTDAGRDVYQAGDLHCTLTGNSEGMVSACVASGNQLKCVEVTVKPTVEVTYPDGRYAAGVTPVVVAF